jgi:hypothetical protein
VTRVAHRNGVFDPLLGHGDRLTAFGGRARRRRRLRPSDRRPERANATSVRSAMTLPGTSLIDNIPDRAIRPRSPRSPMARGRPT